MPSVQTVGPEKSPVCPESHVPLHQEKPLPRMAANWGTLPSSNTAQSLIALGRQNTWKSAGGLRFSMTVRIQMLISHGTSPPLISRVLYKLLTISYILYQQNQCAESTHVFGRVPSDPRHVRVSKEPSNLGISWGVSSVQNPLFGSLHRGDFHSC